MASAQVDKIPAAPKELDEPVRYLAEKLGLTVTLRMPRRIIIDGRDVTVPGLRAKFSHGEFTTWNQEVVELMDGMLTGRKARRWNRIFQRAPSNKDMQIMAEVAKRADAAKKAALEEILKTQPKSVEKFKSFTEFNKKRMARVAPEDRQAVGTRSLGGSI